MNLTARPRFAAIRVPKRAEFRTCLVPAHRRTLPALVLAVVINSLTLGPLHAQDRVINGNFDQDLSGWTLFAGIGANVSAVWSPIDKDGNPASGSAELRDLDLGDSGSQVIFFQCVDVTNAPSSLPWEVSAQVIVEGEPWLRTSISFTEHPGTQCSGGTLGPGLSREVNFDDPTWQTVSGDYIIQASAAGSISVEMLIQKPASAGTGGLARVDGISLGSIEDELFTDRFQSPP